MGNLIRLKAIPGNMKTGTKQDRKKTTHSITLISHPMGKWDPFQSVRCIICWKTLNDESAPIMECPHCHSKAHQEHMLRWLAKKGHCPYCHNKW